MRVKRYCEGLGMKKSIYQEVDGKLVARVVIRDGLTDEDLREVAVLAAKRLVEIRAEEAERIKRRDAVREWYKHRRNRPYWWKSDYFWYEDNPSKRVVSQVMTNDDHNQHHSV